MAKVFVLGGCVVRFVDGGAEVRHLFKRDTVFYAGYDKTPAEYVWMFKSRM